MRYVAFGLLLGAMAAIALFLLVAVLAHNYIAH